MLINNLYILILINTLMLISNFKKILRKYKKKL